MSKRPEEPYNPWRDFALFGVIVTDLVGFSSAGVVLGYLAWKHWGTPSWTLAVTGMLGLGAAVYRILLLVKARK